MLQETIRQLIETKLNNNTADKEFIVGSYANFEDEKKHFVYNIKTGYSLISTNYIPCMISFSSDFEPLPNQINGSANIGAQFLLLGEKQADFQDDLEALNEVISKIVGNYESFDDEGTSFNSVWNMDALTPAGIVGPLNGNFYTQINTTFYVDFSDTYEYGNAYKMSLTGTDNDEHFLTVPDGNQSRQSDEDVPHRRGGKEGLGGVESTRWSGQIVTYIDDFTETFVETILGGDDSWANIYQYKLYKNDVLLNEFPVMANAISQPFVLGERPAITIELIKSDKALELV